MRIPKINDGTLTEVLTCAGLVTGKWRASDDPTHVILNDAYYTNDAKATDVAFIDITQVIRIKPVTGVKGIPVFSDADKIQAHGLGIIL
jgi:hypothetical protein